MKWLLPIFLLGTACAFETRVDTYPSAEPEVFWMRHEDRDAANSHCTIGKKRSKMECQNNQAVPRKNRCQPGFEAHFDVLYWKPCSTAYQWGKLNNQQLYVNPEYDWGFRLGGKCRQWELSWTYLHTDDSVAEINPNLQIYVPGLTTANAARAKTLFTYNKVNLRGSCSIFYAGVRWTKIRRTNRLDSTPTGTVNERALFQGGGFELGLSGSYCLCDNIRFKASLGSFAIIGEQESTYTFNDFSSRIPAKADCVYGIDFQIALASEFPCGCLNLFGEIGYEMETYFKALTLVKTIPLRTNVSFAGPYFRLGARF